MISKINYMWLLISKMTWLSTARKVDFHLKVDICFESKFVACSHRNFHMMTICKHQKVDTFSYL